MENKNKEDKIIEAIRKFAVKRKILFALLVIAIFGILIPLIIDLAYFIGRYLPSIEAPWGASDVFVFYGTLLSATATIIAVTWTIMYSRKSAEEDRILSKNDTIKNIGMQVSFELMSSLENGQPYFIIHEFVTNYNKSEYKMFEENIEKLKLKCAKARSEIACNFQKFQFVYPCLCEVNINILANYINQNRSIISEIIDSFYLNKEITLTSSNFELFCKLEQHTNRYPEILGTLREIVDSYDSRLAINCNQNYIEHDCEKCREIHAKKENNCSQNNQVQFKGNSDPGHLQWQLIPCFRNHFGERK